MEPRSLSAATILMVAFVVAHPSSAQTLWTSPHGPGMRGLSPATVAAQPALKWKLLLPQGIGHGGVTFSDGGKYLYFKTYGPEQGRVYKVEAATGRLVWKSQLQFGDHSLSGITVDDQAGRLYTAGNQNSLPDRTAFLTCLDPRTGAPLWKTAVSSRPGLSGQCGDGNILISPRQDRLYVHDGAGHVAAFSASNGGFIWITNVPPSTSFYRTTQTLGPAWTDQASGKTRLVVTANVATDAVSCLQDDGASASVVWRASPAKGVPYRWWGHVSASLDGSKLYVNAFRDARGPTLVCLDASDGAVVWALTDSPSTPFNLYPPPCVGADGTVYAAGFIDDPRQKGGVVAVAPDGKVRWTLDTKGGELGGWPAVTANGVIYAVDQAWYKMPYLIAVRDMGTRGIVLWRVRIPDNYGVFASPVPGPDGTLYVASVSEGRRSSSLYAFAPSGGPGVVPSTTRPAFDKRPLRLQREPSTAVHHAAQLAAHPGSPELVPQLGHSFFVYSLAYSPDGRSLVTGSRDATAIVWDVDTGKELRRLRGHTARITSVAVSPDGKTISTASRDGTARLWDAATGRESHRLRGHSGFVTSVSYSPDGGWIATGSEDNTARLWNAATGQEVRKFIGHTDWVQSVAFSPDGRHLATCSNDLTARLWSVAKGKQVRAFSGHSWFVTSCAFSPNGRYLATGSEDRTARLWDVTSGREVRRFEGHTSPVVSVAFSPDGRRLATSGEDRTARLWDVASGKQVRRFDGPPMGLGPVAISPDGARLAKASDAIVRIWNTASGLEVRRLEGRSGGVRSVAFSPDGRFLTAGTDDKIGCLWDVATGNEASRIQGHSSSVVSVAFFPDGRQLATGSEDKTARLWEAATGRELRRLEGHTSSVYAVVASPDGSLLATGSSDASARLWDAATGKELRRLLGHDDSVLAVAFSPDGRSIATGGGDNTARLWETATGRELRRLEGHLHYVTCVAFSPDGKRLASCSWDHTARVWDVASGRELLRLNGHSDWVNSIAFSPDGRYLATGSDDKTARLWDSDTGKELRRLSGPSGVLCLAYSPDGRYLATGGYDGTIRVWDPRTGRLLCQLISFRDGSWAVVDPQGRYDASSDDIDGLVWVVGNEPISLSQLKDRYYEPGLLAKVLGYNKEPLRDVAPFQEVELPPVLEVFPPAKGSTIAKVKVVARGGGIGRVVVSVNGSEFIADARWPGMRDRATIPVDLQYAATLKPGAANTITAAAYTQVEPRISSRAVNAAWKAPGKPSMARPRFHAVVVGISDYPGTDLDLKYAGKDAVDLYTTLKLAANRLFQPQNVDIRLLATAVHPAARKPTKAAIQKVIADFRKSQTGDTVLIYLIGHGVTLKQGQDTYCYLTQDARSVEGVLHDPVVRRQASVTSNELAAWLKTTPALKRVVVLDTCSAGSIADALIKQRGIPGDQVRAMALLHGRVGTQILMGCAADAVSYEATRFGQGLLTYAVLDGVRGPALQNGEFVDVGALFSYVSGAVPVLAGSLGGVQKPEFRAKGQPFAVGRMLEEDRAKVPLGSERPVILRPVFLDQNTGDRLRLAERVRERVKELDWAAARGAAPGRGIAFVDREEMEGALRPSATYTVNGTNVLVHLVVWRDGARIYTGDIAGTTDKIDDLASSIIETVTGAWKLPGSSNEAEAATG